ncbi:partitioning defective 6 beta-like protein [Leptotrombidium deliense]|uniref:Partitioning defective 6 beta-like protein n=1 Tax=Leptotrombidium deliense TaxID=299467 RepID=A0A443SAU6_9ACAR|nr:partitioning defective 6 beta-like protein [Leptotrombidium deliense]
MFRNNSQNSNLSSNKENLSNHSNSSLIEIKSKFDAEFRRFSVEKSKLVKFDDFYKLIEHFHKLFDVEFNVYYTDPSHGDLLPINNDDNFAKAVSLAKPTLRLIIQRKGESWEYLNGTHGKKKNFLNNLVVLNNLLPIPSTTNKQLRPSIGLPEDFRQVSAIIDVDIIPDTYRRVRLVKHGSDKPLGFYIRDGTSLRVTSQGFEKVPGIFISRLVPGGLAESTGLLAVNDEVLEVNGIDVFGKSLDQVTDMMVANSSNLIITIRPANQKNYVLPRHSNPSIGGSSTGHAVRGSVQRSSQLSQGSGSRNDSAPSVSDDEEDEVKDHLGACGGSSTGSTRSALGSKTITTSAKINLIVNESDDDSDDIVRL